MGVYLINNKNKHLLCLGRLFFLGAVLVLCLIALGGVTRLTGSGLSIPEWQLIFGIFPPMTHVQWERLFEAYQSSPEFQQVNFFMTLEGFKDIFWLEYWHRFVARIVFFLFFGCALFFIIRRNIPTFYKKILIVILVLYLAQGIVGWLMVKSGLSKDASVSPYFLGIHLILALILYTVLIWNGLKIMCRPSLFGEYPLSRSLKVILYGILGFLGITIFFGALVAGYKSGFLFPTFPKMGQYWIAPESWSIQPFWRNFFENPTGVYAVHRLLACLTFIIGLSFCLRQIFCFEGKIARVIFGLPLILFINQITLGALTAMSQVYLVYAVLHQVNAFLVWGSFLGCLFYVSSQNFKVLDQI